MTDIVQDIPHLEARVDIDNSYKESSLNLHPSQDLMNQAYKVRIELAGIGSEVIICMRSINVRELCENCPDFVGKFNLHIEEYLRKGSTQCTQCFHTQSFTFTTQSCRT